MQVKARLIEQWQRASKKKFLSADENALFAMMNAYADVLYTRRSLANGPMLRVLYCLHVLNHIYKYVSVLCCVAARPQCDSQCLRAGRATWWPSTTPS